MFEATAEEEDGDEEEEDEVGMQDCLFHSREITRKFASFNYYLSRILKIMRNDFL
jgi:hypothetical protein